MTKKTEEQSFEDALKALESLVESLESGQIALEDAVKTYEKGILLKKHCETKLTEAKMKIDKVVKDTNGALSVENFET
ncbi:MAG: exodeoxyribonuclease VII small subunit [Alphaproteobacteria bacterium]